MTVRNRPTEGLESFRQLAQQLSRGSAAVSGAEVERLAESVAQLDASVLAEALALLEPLQVANSQQNSRDQERLDALKATLRERGAPAASGMLALRGSQAVKSKQRHAKPTPQIPVALASGDDAQVLPSVLQRGGNAGGVVTNIVVEVSASMSKPADPALTQPMHYRKASVALAAVPGSTVRVYNKDVLGEDGQPKLLAKFTAGKYKGPAQNPGRLPTSFAAGKPEGWGAQAPAVPDGWVAQSFELPDGADWLPADTLLITQERGKHPESKPIEVPLQSSVEGKKRSDPADAATAEQKRIADVDAKIAGNQLLSGTLTRIHQGLRAPAKHDAVKVDLHNLPAGFELKVVNPLAQQTQTFHPDAQGRLQAEISNVCNGDGLQYEVSWPEAPFATQRVAVEVGAAKTDSPAQKRFIEAFQYFSPEAHALVEPLFLGPDAPLAKTEDWAQALNGYIFGALAHSDASGAYLRAFDEAGQPDLRAGFEQARSGKSQANVPEAVQHHTELLVDGSKKKERFVQWGRGETWRYAIRTPGSKYRVAIRGLSDFEFTTKPQIEGHGRFTM